MIVCYRVPHQPGSGARRSVTSPWSCPAQSRHRSWDWSSRVIRRCAIRRLQAGAGFKRSSSTVARQPRHPSTARMPPPHWGAPRPSRGFRGAGRRPDFVVVSFYQRVVPCRHGRANVLAVEPRPSSVRTATRLHTLLRTGVIGRGCCKKQQRSSTPEGRAPTERPAGLQLSPSGRREVPGRSGCPRRSGTEPRPG